jgi:hypothetical protein
MQSYMQPFLSLRNLEVIKMTPTRDFLALNLGSLTILNPILTEAWVAKVREWFEAHKRHLRKGCL